MLAALWVKCPDSRPSETWVFSPHNFGLWVASRAHTQLPQSCLHGFNSLQSHRMALGHTELQSSQRQEVIWLAWNFIKLWVELHGRRESLSKRPPFIDQARLQQRGGKKKQHPCVWGCQQEQSPQLFAIKNAECVHFLGEFNCFFLPQDGRSKRLSKFSFGKSAIYSSLDKH